MDGQRTKKNMQQLEDAKIPPLIMFKTMEQKNVPFPAFVGQFFVRKNSSQKKKIWKPDPYPYHPCMVHLPAFG